MKKSIVFPIAFIVLATSVLPQQAPPPLTPQEQAAMAQERVEFMQEMDGLVQERAALDGEFGQMRQELHRLIQEMANADPGWFPEFRRKMFLTVPLNAVGLEHVGVGLYGSDIFHALFFAAFIGVDYVFYKSLHDYYLGNVLNNFYQKKQMLITLMRNDNGLDQAEVNKFVAKEIESLFTIEKNVTIKSFLNLFGYILSNEFVEYCEQSVFQQKGRSVLGVLEQLNQLDHANENAAIAQLCGIDYVNGRYIVPTWTVLWPLWIRYRGVLSNLNGSLSTIRTLGLKLAGYHHKFLDSYWFGLSKRLLILTRFLKQSNESYKKYSLDFVQKHEDQFLILINKMAEQKDSGVPQKEIDTAMQALLAQAHEQSFLQWVRFKNQCLARTDFMIEMVLMVPVWYKIVQFIYRNAQAA